MNMNCIVSHCLARHTSLFQCTRQTFLKRKIKRRNKQEAQIFETTTIMQSISLLNAENEEKKSKESHAIAIRVQWLQVVKNVLFSRLLSSCDICCLIGVYCAVRYTDSKNNNNNDIASILGCTCVDVMTCVCKIDEYCDRRARILHNGSAACISRTYDSLTHCT